jgi:O-antigen/teichoic acid export membrane protein
MPVAQRRRRFVLEGAFVCLALTVAGILLTLVSYWLIPLLLPSNYMSSIRFIAWLTAITVIGIPGGVAETYFRTQQNERQQYRMRAWGAVTSILFPLLLLTSWEVDGILIGRLASNLTFSILGIWLFIHDRP